MENLSAAIPISTANKTLSTEEFRNLLISWFEDKGIISDLKSYLRCRMINVIRNTTIGRDLIKKSLQKNSLSRQAINLIIADFLIQNQYHYSLSIFNTEATLTEIFPVPDNIESSAFKFDPENIRNIMELIGIPKTHVLCNDLLNLYYSNEEHSILSCLVMLLHKITHKEYGETPDNFKYTDLKNETNFIKQIGSILIEARLPPDEFKIAIQNAKLYLDIEIKDVENKHEKVLNMLRSEKMICEDKLTEVQKSKKLIERKMIKLAREYKSVKSHVKEIIEEKLINNTFVPETIENKVEERIHDIDEKLITTFNCNLPHCTERCKDNLIFIEKLKKENRELKKQKEKQTGEIINLSSNYNNLLKDFMDCQNKISLLNTKVNQGDCRTIVELCDLEEKFTLNKDDLSSGGSSESVTEQLLKETRIRLKVLEEESKVIEENYKTLQQGISQIKL